MSPSANPALPSLDAPLIIGFGITSRAVAEALVERGHRPTVVEDRPTDDHRQAAARLGIELVEQPSEAELQAAVAAASVLLPSPGVPDHHRVFDLAKIQQLGLISEFDLAQAWDGRPVAAITGTNGKTTVTTMVTDALNRSNIRAEAVGNTEVPFVQAIADPATEVFVVEASSFRLAHSAAFRPDVAAWINFAPDHLDAHAGLEAYEQAKASIWDGLGEDATLVANADDSVVMGHAVERKTEGAFTVTFGTDRRRSDVTWRLESVDGADHLVGPGGPLIAVAELRRRQPHDVSNALATAAIATAMGASLEGVVETLASFDGLAHRLEFLGSWDKIGWYNDSKATVPHATVAAVGGFDSVVLIAGGRNKGLALDPLRDTVPPVRAVVAIGDAAPEVAEIFDGLAPVVHADSMETAIQLARDVSKAGDVVLLSPACTSFDWYPNYVERGLAFSHLVRQEMATT